MVQLIVGNKGKGKTKVLLEKVNSEVKKTSGNIVYLDSNTKHMFELNNRIRLIDASRYPLTNSLDSSSVLFRRIMIYRKCILTASLKSPDCQMRHWE